MDDATWDELMTQESLLFAEEVRRGERRWPGVELRGAQLDGLELSGAVLDQARLDRASLRGARLSGASLVEAKLRGACLAGARLVGAELRGADLRGADLQGADLRGASLVGADLQGADLRGARLDQASVSLACRTFAGVRVDEETLGRLLTLVAQVEAPGPLGDELHALLTRRDVPPLLGSARWAEALQDDDEEAA